MAERFSRRGVLAGMTFAAADLLFSREISRRGAGCSGSRQ